MPDLGVAIVCGAGTADMRDQWIDAHFGAKPKHLTINFISMAIDTGGALAGPSIRPQAVPLLERGVAAVALGFVAPPLAPLATIRLGVDDPHGCAELVDDANEEARTGIEGAPLVDDGSQAADPAGSLGFPRDVTGKGDASVRQLNQEELDQISRQRR